MIQNPDGTIRLPLIKCENCRGLGEVIEPRLYSDDEDDTYEEVLCPICKGTGHREIDNEQGETE